MSKIKSIAFVGMSHLGLCYSAATAKKGFKVIAFDESKNKINKYKNLEIDIHEKNLKNLIKKNINKNLFFDSNLDNLKKCNLVFISLDIPTDSSGKSDIIFIKNFVKKIITKINQNNCTLVLLSQIPPGFTNLINWPKHRLYYQVETLIFGNAIERASKPERIIVGSYKKKIICKNYKFFLSNFKCPIINLNYESAELAKTAINLFLISQVSTTNFLASICEKTQANWNDIKESLQLDRRIGKYSYLKPGLGLSGGNLERDLKTLLIHSKKFNIDNNLLRSFQKISKKKKLWVRNILSNILKRKKNKMEISLLGITYKENTNSIKNAPSIYLIKKFKNTKFKFYDKQISKLKFKNLTNIKTIQQVIIDSNILIIFYSSKEFVNIKLKWLLKMKKNPIIIDPFGVLINLNLKKINAEYYTMGLK